LLQEARAHGFGGLGGGGGGGGGVGGGGGAGGGGGGGAGGGVGGGAAERALREASSLLVLASTGRMLRRTVLATELGLQSEESVMRGEQADDAGPAGAPLPLGPGGAPMQLGRRHLLACVGDAPAACARWRVAGGAELGHSAHLASLGRADAADGGAAQAAAAMAALAGAAGGGGGGAGAERSVFEGGGGGTGVVALIDRFVVLEKYRRRGVGVRLLRAVLQDVASWAQLLAAAHGRQGPAAAAAFLPAVALLVPATVDFDAPLALFSRAGFRLAAERLAIAPPARDPTALFAGAVKLRRPREDMLIADEAARAARAGAAGAAGFAGLGGPALAGSDKHTELAVLVLSPAALLAIVSGAPM